MGRPLQEAMQSQQEQINAMGAALNQCVSVINQQRDLLISMHRTAAKQDLVTDYIARIAGITPQVTAIRKRADVENPAQPVPNPASQQATETTEQAVMPETYDNAMAPGMTPGSVQQLPADTTGTPMDPGATLPTAPYNDLTDVTAPVAGAETQRPLPETRTEVDVRVGDPMNLERAFPWQPNVGPDAMGGGQGGGQQQRQSSQQQGQQRAASRQEPEQSDEAQSANRTTASIRLARLRIQAGVANGEDLSVAAGIEADANLSDSDIDHEINTLSNVMRAASSRQGQQQRPGHLVPRAASSVQRTTPSLANGGGGQQAMASASNVGDDTADADLFY